MRFLIDMPLSVDMARWLRRNGQDAVHASEIGMFLAPDEALMELAAREDRIVITKDLGIPRRLALSKASAPAVVLFRWGNYTDAALLDYLKLVIDLVDHEVLQRSVVVVEPAQIRVTRLPLT